MWVFIQVQLVTITSVPSFKKMHSGARLIKKASLIAVFTCEVAQFWGRGCGLRVVRMGRSRRMTIRRREGVMIVVSIVFAWTCTKSFWFLRPTDGCYPSKAGRRGSFRV